MRILFDSKKTEYKSPFGCVAPGQECTLHIHIPCTVKTSAVSLCLYTESGGEKQNIPFAFHRTEGPYDIWKCVFSLGETGLFFYRFSITGHTGTFRLFKQGNDTNMEAGDLWQISCVPADHTVPDWAKGAVIYQVFPDRFARIGTTDLTGKLGPYTLHENWDAEVDWRPNEKGEVLNNDFFGGNFRGITEKMDYIASLGTEILYLNPISMSFSNHRYDTADYLRPDPMLGSEADFADMCKAAHDRGIRVVLDGVFSHTGANSVYFDKHNIFGGGAYSDPDSPYRSWYHFKEYPDSYECWWNFDTLPTAVKSDPGFRAHIRGVLTHWLSLGADGFRLDVVDELPDDFVKMLKTHLRSVRPDGLLMGEVWEDASNKLAYGIRRRYFVDAELDSVMNYPYRTAILDFLWQRDDGVGFQNAVMTILENYPHQVSLCNMNMLGTHDTPRILTTLVDDFDGDRAALAQRTLSGSQLAKGKQLLRLASVLQYTLPGCPSLYYADEAGMAGGKDPFNRRTYPWGREDKALLEHFRHLGNLRKNSKALKLGNTEFLYAGGGKLAFARRFENQQVTIYVNRSEETWTLDDGTTVAPMDWWMEEI